MICSSSATHWPCHEAPNEGSRENTTKVTTRILRSLLWEFSETRHKLRSLSMNKVLRVGLSTRHFVNCPSFQSVLFVSKKLRRTALGIVLLKKYVATASFQKAWNSLFRDCKHCKTLLANSPKTVWFAKSLSSPSSPFSSFYSLSIVRNSLLFLYYLSLSSYFHILILSF